MTDYSLLNRQLNGLLSSQTTLITNLSQFSAFIYNEVSDLNWAGFYLAVPSQDEDSNAKKDLLVLGPFNGNIACTPIPFDKGVCGLAATTKSTQRIADVNQFSGHIACDSRSQSELVIPILLGDGRLFGVFDLDSPTPNRFALADEKGIQSLLGTLIKMTDFSKYL